MEQDVDAIDLSEEEQILYFEGLGAIANADDDLDSDEIDFFKGNQEDMELSHKVQKAAKSAMVDPQSINKTCRKLKGSEARYALYLDACEMALADGVVKTSEETALQNMRRRLNISSDKADALWDFAEASHQVKTSSGKAKEKAKEALEEAGASLAGVGVPVGAIAVSGSVAGLSGAGIMSGLAALGLGLGAVSGIGTAVAIGVGSYAGVKKLFGDD